MMHPSVLAAGAGPLTRRAVLGAAAACVLPRRMTAADDFGRLLESFVRPTGGELGFAMHHLESGERFSLRGGERFPMASVYKLPIGIAVLDQVDRQSLSLSQTVRLTPASLRLGMGNNAVGRLVGGSGYDFTVGDLARQMLVDSDNASSDALLSLVGARTVTARMRELGVGDIHVDRLEAALLLDFIGAPSAEPEGGWSLDVLRERYNSATADQRKRAMEVFLQDPRDTTTPDAMVALLEKVHRGQVLKPVSGRQLLAWMRECRTGSARLRGQLPAETVFAHRTGTSATTDGVTGVTNDVGILTLPGRRGHVLIAAFLRSARGSMDEREAVLAQIGRAVYERYVGA